MGATKTKTKSSAGKNVLIFFIVFIVLEMLIVVGLSRVFKNKDVTPSVAGYSLYIMDSNQMGESIPQGSMIIASNGTPSKDKIGNAILCENVKNVGTSVFWLYDISSKDGQDGVVYTVYQEENPDKIYEVTASNIVGVATSYYTTAGKVVSFVSSPFGMICCAVVPLFLLVLLELIIAIATHSPEEEEEYDENNDDNRSHSDNVKLDDFLFGTEKEGEQIAKKRLHIDDAPAPAVPNAEPVNPFAADIKASDDADIFDRSSEDLSFSTKPKVDRSYYEKASKLIDGTADTTSADLEAEPVVRKPVQPARRPRPARPVQRPNISKAPDNTLEDLMKLMDEEQAKLNKTIK